MKIQKVRSFHASLLPLGDIYSAPRITQASEISDTALAVKKRSLPFSLVPLDTSQSPTAHFGQGGHPSRGRLDSGRSKSVTNLRIAGQAKSRLRTGPIASTRVRTAFAGASTACATAPTNAGHAAAAVKQPAAAARRHGADRGGC
jgi:hypothetical protein